MLIPNHPFSPVRRHRISRPLFQLVSSLNEANRRGSKTVITPLTQTNLSFLSFLYRQGLISNYEVLHGNKGSIKIFPRLSGGRNAFGWVYVIPKPIRNVFPKNPLFFPHFSFLAGSLVVVETPLGLLTYSEARALSVKSRLLFRIVF